MESDPRSNPRVEELFFALFFTFYQWYAGIRVVVRWVVSLWLPYDQLDVVLHSKSGDIFDLAERSDECRKL